MSIFGFSAVILNTDFLRCSARHRPCERQDVFEVQPAIGPNSPLSGAAVVIRLGDVTDEEGDSEGGGVEQNEENADSFMPKSDMTKRTKHDYFVHKTRAMRSAHECSVTQTREKCACCERLVGCAVHSPVAS